MTKLDPTKTRERVLEILDERTPEGEFDLATVSADALDWLRNNNKTLYRAWADTILLTATREFYKNTLIHRRTAAMNAARHEAFSNMVEAAETGESPLRALDAIYTINRDSGRKRLADMTAEDLRHVAAQHRVTAAHHATEAVFATELARRLDAHHKGATVQEVMTDSQVVELHENITDQIQNKQEEQTA